MQHPGGQREIDELHVPLGRAVKLIMTSQDVVHSMFIPAFRVKQDVLPSGYSTLWFEATTPGRGITCSARKDIAGRTTRRMVGKVVVMSLHDYQQWLATGNAGNTCARGFRSDGGGRGARLFTAARLQQLPRVAGAATRAAGP